MAIILPGGSPHTCCKCGRQRRDDEGFYGPNMWHQHDWMCQHGATNECPECYRKPGEFASCPVCSCEAEYT